MKKILVSMAAATAIMLTATGCGGGSGSSASANSGTGTGYYVDGPVAGVDYQCGSISGKTDQDGKFTFEEGKGCTFELAGVKLRELAPDSLYNGITVLENNITVAQLLQSFDVDGDPANGIQITEEVEREINQTLHNLQIETIEEIENELDNIVAELQQELGDIFKGDVKTEQEVEQHLNETAEHLLKDFLAGKTFYAVGEYIGQPGKAWKGEILFNADLTNVTISNMTGAEDGADGTYSVSVNGDTLVWDDGTYSEFDDEKADYYEFTTYDANGNIMEEFRLYKDKSLADQYYSKLTS